MSFARTSILLALGFLALTVTAQTLPSPGAAYPANWALGLDKPVSGVKPLLLNLWDKTPPGFIENAPPERDDGTGRIWNVNVPGLLLYLPANPNPATHPDRGGASPAAPPPPRTAIIECMGGSYTHLTRLVGGDNTVEILLPRNIVVISLKYRLKPPSKNVEADSLADGRRAIRMVRAHAKEWNIDPRKIGMLGFSAGGNLILNLATHPEPSGPTAADPIDRQSDRPDFIVLISPWPDAHDISAYPAPKDPPPAFIANARDDTTAPFTFAKAIEAQWQKAGGKTVFLEAQTGGHGSFEIGTRNEGAHWPDQFLPWLHSIGMD